MVSTTNRLHTEPLMLTITARPGYLSGAYERLLHHSPHTVLPEENCNAPESRPFFHAGTGLSIAPSPSGYFASTDPEQDAARSGTGGADTASTVTPSAGNTFELTSHPEGDTLRIAAPASEFKGRYGHWLKVLLNSTTGISQIHFEGASSTDILWLQALVTDCNQSKAPSGCVLLTTPSLEENSTAPKTFPPPPDVAVKTESLLEHPFNKEEPIEESFAWHADADVEGTLTEKQIENKYFTPDELLEFKKIWNEIHGHGNVPFTKLLNPMETSASFIEECIFSRTSGPDPEALDEGDPPPENGEKEI